MFDQLFGVPVFVFSARFCLFCFLQWSNVIRSLLTLTMVLSHARTRERTSTGRRVPIPVTRGTRFKVVAPQWSARKLLHGLEPFPHANVSVPHKIGFDADRDCMCILLSHACQAIGALGDSNLCRYSLVMRVAFLSSTFDLIFWFNTR